jgi:predicted RNA-binding protein with RPS1 domain
MPLEAGKTVIGRIVEVTERGLVVSLSDEDTGIVPASASLSLEAMMERFSSGAEIRVLVGIQDEDGAYALSIEQRVPDADALKFDQEFAKLNHVLTNHTSRSPARPAPSNEPSIEERMEDWIARAEEGLARLRKNRGKRLSEEFYNNEH